MRKEGQLSQVDSRSALLIWHLGFGGRIVVELLLGLTLQLRLRGRISHGNETSEEGLWACPD